MKLIPTRDAVGHVLCHDMTQIIPGQYKDARFRKGHVVPPGAGSPPTAPPGPAPGRRWRSPPGHPAPAGAAP